MIVFTVELNEVPATGNLLVLEVQKALANVEYNIGPEPLRFTTGPIYGGDGDGTRNQRVGTWEIAQDPAPNEGAFVAVKSSILKGDRNIATARSKTTAKRIAKALNNHKPNSEGV